MTTTSTIQPVGRRVYIRRLGYASLLKVHADHSVTVRLEDDGSEEQIPFGDWSYDRSSPAANTTSVEIRERIKTALHLDFGDDFTQTDSGVDDTLMAWLTARLGAHRVHIMVAPED